MEQAYSSVLFEENARKAFDEKPFPVFQIATDDSCATGLLENQTTSKILNVFLTTKKVAKEEKKKPEVGKPATPESFLGVNQASICHHLRRLMLCEPDERWKNIVPEKNVIPNPILGLINVSGYQKIF